MTTATTAGDQHGSNSAKSNFEIYRSGGIIIQLIDADYDGRANVLRTYDSDGELVRQERL